MSDEKFDAARATRVLNHPVRVRIIELLGSKGPLSWKDLSGQLGTSTGSLYHHVDMLERLVTRDSSKRYLLTEQGREVYDLLKRDSLPRSTEGLKELFRQRPPMAFVRGLFIPRSLIHSMTTSRSRSSASSMAISLLVLALLTLSKDQVVLFSFSPSPGALQSVESFVASLLTLTGLTFAGMKAFRVRPDPMVLLTATSLAYLPLADFSLLLRSLASLGDLGFLADRNALTVVFVCFQAWGASIIGAGISVASGLRIERTLVASLALLYATTIVMFVQGVRFI